MLKLIEPPIRTYDFNKRIGGDPVHSSVEAMFLYSKQETTFACKKKSPSDESKRIHETLNDNWPKKRSTQVEKK